MTRKSKPPLVAITFAPDALAEWLRVQDASVLSNRNDYNRYLGLADEGLAAKGLADKRLVDKALVPAPKRKKNPTQ